MASAFRLPDVGWLHRKLTVAGLEKKERSPGRAAPLVATG